MCTKERKKGYLKSNVLNVALFKIVKAKLLAIQIKSQILHANQKDKDDETIQKDGEKKPTVSSKSRSHKIEGYHKDQNKNSYMTRFP